jgi:mono/diheme cytochrome c family protein
MKLKSWILILIAFAILVAAAGCGSSTSSSSTSGTTATQALTLDGKALAEERCSTCHSFTRATGESQTADQWQRTVNDMIQKGANLNTDEAAAVVAYLAKTYGK